MSLVRLSFPDGFLWGAATAAHQVEGNNVNSDWWHAEEQGRLPFKSGRAAEQYTRYESDFDLAAELGHGAHRLSVEWARIEPKPGLFDDAEIEHYVTVLKALKARGLTSYVTLHHFTNPMWFAEQGGWLNADAPALFQRFVERVTPALAPYVDYWLTFNEPTTVAQLGYIEAKWPPFRTMSLLGAVRMIDAQAEAHNRAFRAIKRKAPGATVGYTNTFVQWRPINATSPVHRTMTRLATYFSNHRFCDAVNAHTDFIGLQYYFTLLAGWVPHQPGGIDTAEKSDLGWDIVPQGLYEVTMDTWRRYGRPIHVTENGLADEADSRRERFIRAHLSHLHRSIDDGADVRAYLHWALIDNFEWAFGYEPRFGLIAVDYDTQERSVRPSARAYERIIRENGFDWEGE